MDALIDPLHSTTLCAAAAKVSLLLSAMSQSKVVSSTPAKELQLTRVPQTWMATV